MNGDQSALRESLLIYQQSHTEGGQECASRLASPFDIANLHLILYRKFEVHVAIAGTAASSAGTAAGAQPGTPQYPPNYWWCELLPTCHVA